MAILVLGILFVLGPGLSGSGWVRVPREVYEYDRLPGQEVLVKGFLEPNDRALAIPKEGEAFFITEEEIDRMAEQGLLEGWDFRQPGWTHRIQLTDPEDPGIPPSYVAEDGGEGFYLVVSSGTEVWRSEDLLDDYSGKVVELVGKWDYFTDPLYPGINITQFYPRSIREADGG